MKYILIIFSFCFTPMLFAQQTDVVTNQTIIELHKAGLSRDVIKAKITASTCTFDMSTDALISLKKASIPDDIIEAMLIKQQSATPTTTPSQTIPQYPTETGIYYLDTATKQYTALDPSVLTNQKSGGLGSVLRMSVSGMFTEKQRASLSGKQGAVQLHTTTPHFLFVFDTTSRGFANSNTFLGSVQSPNEFFLVKLSVTKKSREVVVGKVNNIKSDVGIDDDIKIPFTAKKIQKGVYEVIPSAILKDGEYCFMFAASSMYAGQTHKVYDFGVVK